MKVCRKSFLGLLIMGILIFQGYPARAVNYVVGGKELFVQGFIRQEFSFNYNSNSPSSESGLQSAYQMWYLESTLTLNRNTEVKMINRFWGDLIYALKGDANHFKKYFKGAKHRLQWDDDAKEIFREFYVSYCNPRFSIRAGKQQIGWGEADGLRLMDIINPLDTRRDALFYDTIGFEEVRVPKWLLKMEYYPGKMGQIYNTAIQFIWNPGDVRQNRELLPAWWDCNATPPMEIPNSCGVWGMKTPRLPMSLLMIEDHRADSIDNSEFGVRLSGCYRQAWMTLSFWQGFASGAGYYLNEITKFRGLGFDPQRGVYARFDRTWPRIKILGFTLNNELGGVAHALHVSAAPVLRIEAMYSFDEEFNTSEIVMGMTPMGMMPVDINKQDDADFLRDMIGFDWPIRIKWINPRKNTFFSVQFFHFYNLNYHQGVRSPVMLGCRTPRNWYFGTLLVRTEFFNDRVCPSVLFVQDYHTGAAWSMTECNFLRGDHWRLKLRWLWIGAGHTNHTDPKSFAFWENRDQISFRIVYQF